MQVSNRIGILEMQVIRQELVRLLCSVTQSKLNQSSMPANQFTCSIIVLVHVQSDTLGMGTKGFNVFSATKIPSHASGNCLLDK